MAPFILMGCLSVCLCIYLSICLSVGVLVCLSPYVCLAVLPVCQSGSQKIFMGLYECYLWVHYAFRHFTKTRFSS